VRLLGVRHTLTRHGYPVSLLRALRHPDTESDTRADGRSHTHPDAHAYAGPHGHTDTGAHAHTARMSLGSGVRRGRLRGLHLRRPLRPVDLHPAPWRDAFGRGLRSVSGADAHTDAHSDTHADAYAHADAGTHAHTARMSLGSGVRRGRLRGLHLRRPLRPVDLHPAPWRDAFGRGLRSVSGADAHADAHSDAHADPNAHADSRARPDAARMPLRIDLLGRHVWGVHLRGALRQLDVCAPSSGPASTDAVPVLPGELRQRPV
jgi:hypothetical protein